MKDPSDMTMAELFARDQDMYGDSVPDGSFAINSRSTDITPRHNVFSSGKSFNNPFLNLAGQYPETAARTAQIGAPTAVFAGMAAAGTMLDGIFGGKPSSEYKTPVQPRSYQTITSATAGGGFGPYNNANIAASNASTANTAYLETLKHKHNLEIIAAKARARDPVLQEDTVPSRSESPMGLPRPGTRGGSPADAYASAIQKPSAMNEELMSFARMLYGTGLKL